jgi:hypothetical protein
MVLLDRQNKRLIRTICVKIAHTSLLTSVAWDIMWRGSSNDPTSCKTVQGSLVHVELVARFSEPFRAIARRVGCF